MKYDPPDLSQNPYRLPNVAPERDDEVEERRDASGLTGEHLDNLLRNAHVEGQRLGAQRTAEVARRTYPEVWDQGYEKGREDGARESEAACHATVSAMIPAVISRLYAIRGITGSEEVRDEAKLAAEQLESLYTTVTGKPAPDAG